MSIKNYDQFRNYHINDVKKMLNENGPEVFYFNYKEYGIAHDP